MNDPYVDINILPNELLVRTVKYPRHFKRERIYRSLFLPSANGKDVSTYRNRYAPFDKCKQTAFSLSNEKHKYWGLASFLVNHIDIINEKDFGVKAIIVGSPMDENRNYILERLVRIDESGQPFHADLSYGEAYRVEPDEPSTPHREYANALLEMAKICQDPEPESDYWAGETLLFD
jgi:hypothetical protein